MADAVKTNVLINSGNTYAAVFTNVSDGTGEAAVVKVDKSALTNVLGQIPTKLRIVSAEWCVQGFPYVKIAFDASTDDTALVLSGVGKMCLGEKYGDLVDPLSSGATGDIVFTAPAGAATGSYTIVLHVRKN